ncbi:MAG: Gfo/Idh/MocA family oxidoreductase [Planctomycetia bacterium]|nr:Gfo/Idh/MocA family oxidoreductase [Planctomycetia bacterium]
MEQSTNSKGNRRVFMQKGSVLAASSLSLAAAPKVHAGENNTIRIALVGCGNRGTGALRQALAADPHTKIIAIADAFEQKANLMGEVLKETCNPEQFGLEKDRIFSGLDAYKNAIDSLSPGDVVILATPPAFRPLHFEYAVQKGVNIFAEKPLSVDVPGLRRLAAANKIAKEKGLRIAVGLNNRHYPRTEETIRAIHDGKLGDIFSCWVYRCQAHRALSPKGNLTPLQHQLKNLFNFDWTCGGFIVDGMIHNIDICCWAKNDWPVEVQGIGGILDDLRLDQRPDMLAVEYTFADGKRLMIQGRSMNNNWQFHQANIQGTKGCTQVGEGVREPRIYAGSDMVSSSRKEIWTPSVSANCNSYQEEHNRFFAAIRAGKEWNEVDRSIKATFTAIMGRIAYQTGERLTAEKIWTSKYELVPNVDTMSIDGPSPLMPDEQDRYFVPIPGIFKFS